MARTTLNTPDIAARPPNTGDSPEYGDSWKAIVDKLNLMTTELYAGVQLADGATSIRPSGNINADMTLVGSSATNATQTLKIYSLPASSLNAAGKGVLIVAWGRSAANAAPKTLALNVGGQFLSTGASNANNTAWRVSGRVYRTAANAQTGMFEAIHSNVGVNPKATSDTSTEASPITISVTALDASAAQSNILIDGFTVEFFN